MRTVSGIAVEQIRRFSPFRPFRAFVSGLEAGGSGKPLSFFSCRSLAGLGTLVGLVVAPSVTGLTSALDASKAE